MKLSSVKPVKASLVQSTHMILPEDTNSLGTIFGGRLMAWMDLAAATCAIRHSQSPCVTVSVDELHFKAPVKLGHFVNIVARMTFIHVSSMEILVTAESENPVSGERVLTCSAFFTFVAKSKMPGAKVQVPELKLTSNTEKRLFREGALRRKRRLRAAQKQLP